MFGKVLFLCVLALGQGSRLWEPSELCPPIHQHYLLQHEYDCTKYYYCEYGMKYIEPRNCAPGTEFSYEQQVCVHPSSANCNLPGPPGPTDAPAPTAAPTTSAPVPTNPPATPPPPVPTTAPPAPVPTNPPATLPPSVPTTAPPAPTTSSTTTTTPASTTLSTTTTTAAPATTPCECEDGGNNCEVDYDARCRDNCNILPWAHATDCDKFWRCEGDKAVRVVCPEGLHFNPGTGLCDFICNAGCVRRTTATTTYADGLKIFVPFNEINTISVSYIQDVIEHAKQH